MRKIWWVARREYIEHVRTKSFIVGVILLPLLIVASVFIQGLLEKSESGGTAVVLEAGSGIGESAVEAFSPESPHTIVLESAGGDLDEDIDRLSGQVRRKEILGFFVLSPGLVEGTGQAAYYTDNVSREQPRNDFQRALTEVVRQARFTASGLEPETVQKIYAPVATREFDLSKAEAAEVDSGTREAKTFIPMIFVYLMFIGIWGQAQMLLTSTVEEKSNRVMEVLLSSVSPFQLLAGKMLGLALVAMTLFTLWMLGGAFMIVRHDLHHLIELSTLGYFMIYFVLGFLVYAAIMAALGSLCNDLKEAQNMMTPVIVILMVPLFVMYWVGKNPDHIIGQVLSYVPLFTPFLMINRISSALPPGMVEIVISIVVLAVSIVITVWLAAKVFRVGVLLYGKQPAPREVFRWLREA